MEINKGNKTALVFMEQSTVGEKLIPLLLSYDVYRKVKVFSKKAPNIKHEKLEHFILEKNKIQTLKNDIKGNDLFCFLDIQRPKSSTPSDIKINQIYSYTIANMAIENKVNQLLFFSSVYTNEDSLNLNSRIRAHLEKSLIQLPFWGVHIFRPSFVIDMEGSSLWGEQLANKIKNGLDKLTGGIVSKYQPVDAQTVAAAMLRAAQQLKSGAFLYQSDYFNDWAKKQEELKLL